MRRLALLLVIAGSLGLLVPLGSSGAPQGAAQKAQAWLGTWETDCCKLYFNDVYRKRSDCSACQPPNPYYWALEGRWNRPGKGWTKMWGSITDKDLGTFQGEWDLAKSDPYDEFHEKGWILLYRDGDKLHGAWKACPLTAQPGPKCPHGHFLHGEKASPAWKIGFRFTQRGHPEDRRDLTTQMGGAGSIVFKSEYDANNKLGPATHGSQVFFRLDGKDFNVQLTINLDSGELSESPRKVTLGLSGKVTSSKDNYCEGGEAELAIQEGRGGAPDKVELDLTRKCHQGFSWVSLNRQRVNVNIELPHRTG